MTGRIQRADPGSTVGDLELIYGKIGAKTVQLPIPSQYRMGSQASTKLLIFETHPVQYRTPVYARLEEILPGSIHVAYASDFSVRGGHDQGFGKSISWDTDLLAGYPSTVLRTDLTQAPTTWNDLDGRGVVDLIDKLCPKAILLNSPLTYRYDYVIYLSARTRRIPLWMRCETQDEAFPRGRVKSALRSAYYRLAYSSVSKAFPIGELSRRHWLSHGLKAHQLHHANYCTPDRAGLLSIPERITHREAIRQRLGISHDQLLVGFFGKLIPKKDPLLLLQSLQHLSPKILQRLCLMFVGSGELQSELQSLASEQQARYGVKSHFPGFVNQLSLVDWYLAADVVVLPSRRAGETWGLVVNEAMQAGCSVIASEAVGCTADFGNWERFRTIPVGSSQALARALEELSTYPRSFDWATESLRNYSIDAAAQAFASAISELN